MPTIKPEVCIVGDRLAVFMGADYKMLELREAAAFAGKIQSVLAHHKRDARKQRKLGLKNETLRETP